jgi:transcriptional regulatory protein LevR/transcriptional regulator with AAA-type ATPase domain
MGKGDKQIMKRIDRIYNYIRESSQKYTIEQLTGQIGFDASEISERLDILRNNVSMELNVLFKMDKVIKIASRPVLYFDKEVLENLSGKKLGKGPIEVSKLEEIITIKEDDSLEKSPFKYLIGANGSLKNQVEQAKAAILYPPNGLHTLIVGQTGVGKTLFVNMMYSYGKFEKKLKEDAPFKIFNCADYYNNSQLLVSHIFGHMKGSFTGADADKQGLVEKADGGILFLDEIHRLPPEGQEMIFYFMDTGTFNRLGETDRKRKANVLIIGATTEEPLSLMKTFIRRIPIVITLPPLNERPLQESVDIIKFLLSNEAHRVNKSIKITADAAKALIGSISFGNIGQLKSNIQLVCAKSFLNGIHNKDYIEINFKSLPDHIKNDLLSLGTKRNQLEELAKYLDETIVITPQGHKVLVEDDPYEPPFNLYKIIEDKATLLREEGMSEGLIKKFITVDINLHIKSFYNKFNNRMSSREKMLKIVDKNLLELAEEIQELARKRLKKEYKDQFLYALSLHLSALFKRLKSNQSLQYTNIESVIKEYPNEFEVALEIKSKVEERYNIEIPKEELAYFTLLLSSIQEEKQGGQVAIIVVTHGNSTATSMVDVTQKLFGYSNLIAVDMPLEVSPKDILDKIVEKIQEIDKENGILLLVDMGSLTSFDTMIMEKANVKVKTLDMVSTSLVLEAARKANIFGMDLESIYNSLKKFKGYGSVIEKSYPHHPDKGVILTICTTGEGTAVKLKELVEDSIHNITDEYIEVIPIGIQDVKERVKEIRQQHKILASVGITNPHIDAPFIPLDSLIDGRGEKILKNIFKNDDFTIVDKGHNLVVRNLCEDSLKQILTYLNPIKIISVLMEFQRVLGKELKREFSNSMQIKLIIHCGCAVERMVIKEGLNYKGDRSNSNATLIKHIKKAAEVFRDTIQIELTEDEILYIADML